MSTGERFRCPRCGAPLAYAVRETVEHVAPDSSGRFDLIDSAVCSERFACPICKGELDTAWVSGETWRLL